MQNKDIEIFLELVNTRNLTKASENLFVSQSVISTRLKKLETELGYDLFLRNKGIREIELTRAGRDFVSLAMRLQHLYEEAALLKVHTESVLRIGCPESVYYDFLEPLALRILKAHPELKLSLEMLDSSEVYQRMESALIDFGFVSYESTHSGVLHSHIYTQQTCLILRKDRKPENFTLSPRDLDPAMEIRLTGGNFTNVSQWRDTWFPGADRCRVEVSSPNMVVKMVQELDSWAILPLETARKLVPDSRAGIFRLTDPPEGRKIYLLRHSLSHAEPSDAIRIFVRELNLMQDQLTSP